MSDLLLKFETSTMKLKRTNKKIPVCQHGRTDNSQIV